MSEDEDKQNKPEELQDLILDLDFVPAWAKSTPGIDTGLASKGKGSRTEGDRSRRGGRDGSQRRGSGHRGRGDGREPRDGRGQQRGHRGRGPRREGGEREQRRPRRRMPLRIDYIPLRDRLSKVVRLIRHSQRAFPINDIADRFMTDPAFFQVKYTVNDKKPEGRDFHLYQCAADEMVFTRMEDCERHAVDACLAKFFDPVEKEVDPPKGNFVCVGRCRKSGTLLGPPNHHAYAEALEAIRRERFPGMSLEAYKKNVEVVHDPEAVEQWKQTQSTQVFYVQKKEIAEKDSARSNVDVESPAPAEQVVSPPEEEEPSTDSNTDTSGSQDVEADSASTEEAAVEPEAPESDPTPTSEDAPAGVVADSEADRPAEPSEMVAYSLKEAQAMIRREHLENQVKELKRAIVSGPVALGGLDEELSGLTKDVLHRERQNPRSILLALRPAFKHMKLHIFRAGDNTFVTGVVPQVLDMKNVADDIRAVIDYFSEHPGRKFADVLEALRPGTDLESEEARHLSSALRWLVEKGHVIEFFDGSVTVPKA